VTAPRARFSTDNFTAYDATRVCAVQLNCLRQLVTRLKSQQNVSLLPIAGSGCVHFETENFKRRKCMRAR